MAGKRRATFNSQWWGSYLSSFRNCFSCGGPLNRRYVKEEKHRRHVCSKCRTITYINPRVVAGLIPVTPDGRVVLLRRGIEPAYGAWSYPAGFLELGETVSDAAVRETFEEIRLPVKPGHMIGLYSYRDAGVVTVVYEGRAARGKKPSVTPEAIEVRAFKYSEIPWKDLAFRSTRDALKDWARRTKNGKRRS